MTEPAAGPALDAIRLIPRLVQCWVRATQDTRLVLKTAQRAHEIARLYKDLERDHAILKARLAAADEHLRRRHNCDFLAPPLEPPEDVW